MRIYSLCSSVDKGGISEEGRGGELTGELIGGEYEGEGSEGGGGGGEGGWAGE